jgi:integrase
MRYSEIRLLQWKQINFDSKTLLVGKSKTENGTGRAIPLNTRVILVLEMWASHFGNRRPEHYVFPSEKYGAGTDHFSPCVYGTDATKPINDWKEAWEGAKRRAGVAFGLRPHQENSAGQKSESLQCRFHDLRHTACTRLLEGGVPYSVVATIMGWSASTAIRMTKRYGHIGQAVMRDAMELLGSIHVAVGSPKNSPKAADDANAIVN